MNNFSFIFVLLIKKGMNMNKRIAFQLTKIAKELLAYWNLQLTPPSQTDVDKSYDVVKDYLKGEGMKCDKLAFQRYMVYQENKETHGEDHKRNSNKFLCVFGFEDKDGTFGGIVTGKQIGRAHV